ncbi:MAG: hypothetical protein R3233_06915, partial [Xanthomonadales bacterium]|nr:hypothetical protein [Xanthomonadales bacterium]
MPAAPSDTHPVYAELVCASNFTFLGGASHPQELVARAAQLGYRALALTDECSLAGAVRALEEARRCAQRGQPIELIPGSLFRLENGSRLVLLPADARGYAQLCTLITRGRRAAKKGAYDLPDRQFEHGLEHCLAVWLPADEDDVRGAHWVASHFPERAWLGVALHLGPDDTARLARLGATGAAAGLPLVACGDVRMHLRSRRMLHDLLAAVRHGCTVAQLGYRALPSGERHLRRRDTLARHYPAALLEESIRVAARCGFRLDQVRYRYPRELVPEDRTPAGHLRELVEDGIRQRWPRGIDARLREQIDRELELITELRYEAYFLTVHDIVRFARSQDILCQGRGSAANSAVCYCLGITEVDPARMNMLFERFISRERDEPPDIDVDFEHERREEVIQYIYRKYGRQRAALAATVISYRPRSAVRDVGKALGFTPPQIERLSRSLTWWDRPDVLEQRLAEQGFAPDNLRVRQLRHLVQALVGFPRHLSQHVGGFVISDGPLAELVPVENAAMEGRTVIQWDKDDLETLGLLKVDCLALGMLTAIHRCLDLVNGYARGSGGGSPCGTRRESTHGGPPAPASREARHECIPAGSNSASLPRTASREAAPAGPATSPTGPRVGGGRQVSSGTVSGKDAAFERPWMDLQRVPEETCLPAPASKPLAMADIPAEDPETYAMIQRADTIGVFQVESRAQMAMLPRLKPACFYDLVIEVAIVRPGPIQGDMVHPYLQRRRGLEQVEYPSDALREVLERTLGVPIFQEQVMQIAMVAAGFSGSEADQLRRSMAAWARRGGMEHMHRRLVRGMLERGYSEAFAEQIFNQIRGFGEYGFPESHAASFALLVYVSAWLKRHHPAAFTAALLNSQPMGFYAPAQLVRDAREHGVEVRPVDVRYSGWDCALETGRDGRPAIRLGLRMVRGMPEAAATRLEKARVQQPFEHVQDLCDRARPGKRALDLLADSGALRGLAGHRHRARWAAAGVRTPRGDLLDGAGQRDAGVTLRPPSERENLAADHARMGLSLRRHPLALLRGMLRQRRARPVSELLGLEHGTPARACGLVTLRQRPATASGTVFLTLED